MYKKNKNIVGIALVLLITGLLFQSCNKDHLEINQDPYGITDDQLKIESKVDLKKDKIKQLKKEVQRKIDEINCRKEIITAMTESLQKHEGESAELAYKLVLMKN